MKILSIFFAVLLSLSAFDSQARPKKTERDQETGWVVDDSALVEAHGNQRRAHFIEAADMEVIEVLPDDEDGLAHQKWIVRLSNGQKVLAVYNSHMCPRVPVRVGDRIGMGGEYVWSDKVGGLMHWLHHDPRDRRPDGYVLLDGQFYCK